MVVAQLAQSRKAEVITAREPSQPGAQLGRYRIGKKLGAGGMGVVLLADDTELHRKVVIKLVRPGDSSNENRQRLVREAQAMAQLSHPNVVPIFDVGVYHDQIFIAMEYLDGGDLAGWMAAKLRSQQEVLDVFIGAGRGLAAAHRVGLVHRDFKPQNVLLGGRGEVKVTDFGLARSEKRAESNNGIFDRTLTEHGLVVGTPAYMAPEQLCGMPFDARVDQVAFCIALYEALCGRRPRDGKTMEDLLAQALQNVCPEQPLIDRGVPPRVRAALRKGMAGKPEERFASMDALLAELGPEEKDKDAGSNKYTILGRLAGGGMADIFLAKASGVAGVERHVVLKRVRSELSADPHFARMFLDEARLAAQLHHPNIAQVYDIGRLGDAYFFTMEYVHGADLRTIFQHLAKQQKQLPIALALHVAAGALAALHHAHERVGSDGRPLRIVHRDVSPSNVMVAYEGVIKLVDFGVAKATQNVEETAAGSIKGKTSYLSPEQCRGEPVDRRSDVFSLGIVLHEMLTSRRLFRRDSELMTMNAILTDAIPPPSARRPEVSPELDAIVVRALSKDREARYATAADMLEAIETLAMREQHLLSSTPMTRFLKELLGVRPLPWLELAPTDIGTMTVSPDLDPVAPDPAALDAPTAGRPDPQVPGAANAGAVPSREKEVAALLGVAPMIGPPRSPSRTPTSAPYFDLPPPPPTQRSVITLPRALALLVIFAGAGAGVAIFFGGKKASPQTPVVKMETTENDDEEAALTADDANAVAGEAVVDAGVTAPAIDARAVEAKPATIADAVANLDWTTALGRCAAAVRLTPADNGNCGVAACQEKKRDLAMSYYRATPAGARARVERACLAAGIKLKRGATRPTTPTQDPCELHPLECHK